MRSHGTRRRPLRRLLALGGLVSAVFALRERQMRANEQATTGR